MHNAAMTVLDEASYHPLLAATRGVALVLFALPECGACRAAERLLPAAVPAGTALFRVDVRQATGLARAFEVFHLPELLLYHDGRFHARLRSPLRAPELAAALRAALAAPAEEEP